MSSPYYKSILASQFDDRLYQRSALSASKQHWPTDTCLPAALSFALSCTITYIFYYLPPWLHTVVRSVNTKYITSRIKPCTFGCLATWQRWSYITSCIIPHLVSYRPTDSKSSDSFRPYSEWYVLWPQLLIVVCALTAATHSGKYSDRCYS
jgi:hypothetical protein